MPRITHYKRNKEIIRAFQAFTDDYNNFFDKCLPKLEQDLNDICLSVISEWYATYEPHKYRRQMSLKNAFKVEITRDKISVDYSPTYLESFHHHQSNEFIFNNSFIGGYHGGSGGDNNPIPRWRTPFLYYTYWGDPAPRSFSPFKKMDDACQKRIDKEINIFEKKLNKHISAIKSRLIR